ncbi:MAG: PA0069 family radical SAM protein [Flavobacterium sp.]|nr:PA0069 family radical SAM protein [Pedobacter sp.]
MSDIQHSEFFKGRGAQINSTNKFLKAGYETLHPEGLDEAFLINSTTQLYQEHPKNIVSISNSPDLPFMHSINPYQGCEHGCVYCYARNSHEYYGFSAGLDFERKIIVKKQAPQLLEKYFNKKNYKVVPIMLSGNTDCYQPIERKLKITRELLKVFLKYKHPVSLISKNNLMLRDIDILAELAKEDLVHISITLNSLNEDLRLKLEPRTVTGKSRLKLIEKLSSKNIPVRLMLSPIIPGLNSDEIPSVIKFAAEAGAMDASYTLVRLNGSVAEIFKDWIHKSFPQQASKVLHLIAECHQGKLNDSRFGFRIHGDGHIADSINQLFKVSVKKYLSGRSLKPFNLTAFKSTADKQLKMFG